MYRIKYFFTAVLFSISVLFAQTGPAIQWQKTVGGNMEDFMESIILETPDGGYIAAGASASGISGDKTEANIGEYDYWIVKLSSTGTIQWQNTIGGTGDDQPTHLTLANDGGYIIGGFSDSPVSGDKTEANIGLDDIWVVKIDNTGTIQWQNTIGGTGDDALTWIGPTSGGGYIIAGSSNSGISGDKTEASQGGYDCWILKIDNAGTIQWQNTIGGDASDRANSILQTPDGGYIVGAESQSGISGDKTEINQGSSDYWILKLDATGNIQWQNTIGGNNTEYLESVTTTMGGGYIVGGFSQSGISGDKTEVSQGGFDYWVVKLDNTGSIQWQNTIGGNAFDQLFSIEATPDAGYILGGYSQSIISGDKTEANIGLNDLWIMKLDSVGNITWQNAIGGTNHDFIRNCNLTSDGGYIIGGFSMSGISGDKTEPNVGGRDFWFIKLEGDCFYPTLTSVTASDLQICIDDSIQLNINGNLLGAAYWTIYSGSCGGTLVDTTSSQNSVWITPGSTTTYFVRGEGGCVTPGTCQSIGITVNNLPVVNAGVDSTICNGDTINITATGADNYSWDNGIGNINPAAVFPSVNTTYVVIGTDVNGCVNTDSVIINVNQLPVVYAGNDTLICEGADIILNASGANSYEWIGLSPGNPLATDPLFTDAIFIVEGTDLNGCSNTDSIEVEVSALPGLSLLIGEDTVCTSYSSINLSATPSGGIFSGAGVSGNSFDPGISGTGLQTITYTFTNGDGCSTDIADIIFVSPCLGTDENELSELMIYPNPANDYMTIQSSIGFERIELVDLAGKVVYISNTANNYFAINMSNLHSGIYLLKVSTQSSTITKKIIKQ